MREFLAQYGAFLLVFGPPAALAFLFFIFLTKRRRVTLSVFAGLGTVPLLCAIISLSRPPQGNVSVEIENVQSGQIVEDSWIDLNGSVSPPEARVFILVHPRTGDRWWVQEPPRQVGGAWECRVNLGTTIKGRGEYYQVMALASASSRFLDVVRGRQLWYRSTCKRPPVLPHSNIVMLRRAE
jgi:hypothetical protein